MPAVLVERDTSRVLTNMEDLSDLLLLLLGTFPRKTFQMMRCSTYLQHLWLHVVIAIHTVTTDRFICNLKQLLISQICMYICVERFIHVTSNNCNVSYIHIHGIRGLQ